MSKIHVLPDENLGGVLREYVEVEMIASNPEDRFTTLEPTDIVRIYESDDICGVYVRYRLVDRKAKVGEKVIVTNALKGERDNCPFDNGYVSTVISAGERGITVNPCAPLYHHEYRVLEPVETVEEGDDVLTVDETEAPRSVLDLLANLAHRLTTLEQQVARRVTELERKLGEYARKIDGIEADIQNINIDLGTVEIDLKTVKENVEMALDDIVTLDERTQPLVALVKAVKGDE